MARLLVTSMALVAVASACTSPSSDAAAPTTQPTTTSTPAPTSAPATTVLSSTTTAAAPHWTDEELAIIQAYEGFQFRLIDVMADPTTDPESLREFTAPGFADALIKVVAGRRAEGAAVTGSVQLRPLTVQFTGDAAAVLRVCRWGQTELVIDGQVVIPADPEPVEASNNVVFLDGHWLVEGPVEEISTGLPCAL